MSQKLSFIHAQIWSVFANNNKKTTLTQSFVHLFIYFFGHAICLALKRTHKQENYVY